jgi:hypothetical protein
VGSGDTFTLGSGGVVTGNVNFAATEGTEGQTDYLAGHGGGVYVKGSTATLVLKAGGKIEGNTATFKGGGVYLETGATLTNNGTIYANGNSDNHVKTYCDYTNLPGDHCNVAQQAPDVWPTGQRYYPNETNLMAKFGTTTVADTFNAIHYYLTGHNDFTSASTSDSNSIIHCGDYKNPGDYIDLPAITVDETTVHDTDMSNGGVSAGYNCHFTDTPMTRITVVGINSFHRRTDQPAGYTDTPHVVFQFANLITPALAMNSNGSNVGGYKESELRAFIVPVDKNYHSSSESGFDAGSASSGAFLKGLEDAVGQDDMLDNLLWAVPRIISDGGDSVPATLDTICDKLWLPTDFEQCGKAFYGNTSENAQNQAFFEHFRDWTSSTMYKFTKSNITNGGYPSYPQDYWFAATRDGSNAWFIVSHAGGLQTTPANWPEYIAPCFCVK